MTEEKPIIEALGYIGGQDECLGGYCEPLIIRADGKEHYVLHEMHTYYASFEPPVIKAKHSKIEFDSLDELTAEFKKVQDRLGIDSSLPWAETDSNCGYKLSKGAWEEAISRRLGL
jgi:hypothetical protein